jgi:hypothetical protein
VRGNKLTSLACWLQINFMRPFDLLTNAWVSGSANTHKAGTLVFRYSNGTDKPGTIMIRDNIRGTPIASGNFAPTAGWDDYKLQMIYPVYPGRTTFSGGVPGIDISIKEDPSSLVFPHLDYAQIFVGPPFGVTPREQYDDGSSTTQTIPEDGTPQKYVRTLVPIDPKLTSLVHPTRVRIRPLVKHPKPSELQYIVIHGKSQATISGSTIDETGYSQWQKDAFSRETASGSWEVRVYGSLGTAAGALTGMVLDIE